LSPLRELRPESQFMVSGGEVSENRFLDEVKFVIDLDLFQRNDECFIRQALFQVRHMECAMDLT
ncbi:hypothetical protein Tco_0853561, partial [Tanacetum coccineum]